MITVEAVLPGYDAKDIEIHVEPQRLFISGRQQENSGETKTKNLEPGQRSEQIFRCIHLPVLVKPNEVTAILSPSLRIIF